MCDYQKLLKKNGDYQDALRNFKTYLEAKIEKKRQQIHNLDEILATIPSVEQEVSFKEKCSAYLFLEVLHESKSRKIFNYHRSAGDSFRQDPPLQPLQLPEYFKKLAELRKKNLNTRFGDQSAPRFRQQCKKKTRSQLQAAGNRKTNQTRDCIISEVVRCLPANGREILWPQTANEANKLLNLYVSDQGSIDPIEIYRVWLREKNPTALTRSQFSQVEDDQLTKLVQLVGDNQWAYIAKLITSKTSIQLRERWFKVLNKSIKRKRWTIYEDLKLVVLVDYFGAGQWNKLHQFFSNRTEVQIRERWCNVLDPHLEVKPWTKEEEEQLKQLQDKHGNAWSVIGLKLRRTDNECRRRFQQLKKS